MNRRTLRDLRKTARMTTLYIVAVGVALIILFPVWFLATMSLMSDFEMYNIWPLPVVPRLAMDVRMEESERGYLVSLRNHQSGEFMTIYDSGDLQEISEFIRRKSNCVTTPERLAEEISRMENGRVDFRLRKAIILNYQLFFQLKSDAWPALMRSIYTAVATILIALTIGGMAGYAFARFVFRGKDALKLSVLFVRMFPAVATAIPATIILANMGLYDRPLGLSFIYSIGSIGLTIWITASVFMGIPKDLEEAAMIFGTSRMGAFMRVTLPLALPGLAACAMYAFIASWNEFAQAIVLTQFNKTFPVVVFEFVLGAQSLEHLACAGGMTLAIPAVAFYLFIRRYILRMWGGVQV